MNLFIEVHGVNNGNPFLISQEDITLCYPESATIQAVAKPDLNSHCIIHAKSGKYTCKESYKQVKAMIEENKKLIESLIRSGV